MLSAIKLETPPIPKTDIFNDEADTKKPLQQRASHKYKFLETGRNDKMETHNNNRALQHAGSPFMNKYGLLLALTALACINAVECALEPTHHTLKGSKYVTMENSLAGAFGRNAHNQPPNRTTDSTYTIFDNLIKQKSLITTTLTFNKELGTMTAGSLTDAGAKMEWANVTKAYYGSYVEVVQVNGRCEEKTFGVKATKKPIVILSPESDNTVTIQNITYGENEAALKIGICSKGSGTDKHVSVWIIPSEGTLTYTSDDKPVSVAGNAAKNTDYAMNRTKVGMAGGCVIIPFGTPMNHKPVVFASIESEDKNYTVWVQDASKDGALICFKPQTDDDALDEVTIHYLAIVNLETRTNAQKDCVTYVDAINTSKYTLADVKTLNSEIADLDAGAFIRSYKLNDKGMIVTHIANSLTKCGSGMGSAVTEATDAATWKGTLPTEWASHTFPTGDDIFMFNLAADSPVVTKLQDIQKDDNSGLGATDGAIAKEEQCEPMGYKLVGTVWTLEYKPTSGCPTAVTLTDPTTNNDYKEVAAFTGDTPTATSLEKDDGVKVEIGAGFVVSRASFSGVLLLLLATFVTIF